MQGLQSFMYTMLADSSPIAARMSLDIIIMVEMYKKNINFGEGRSTHCLYYCGESLPSDQRYN